MKKLFLAALLSFPITGSSAVSIYWANGSDGKLLDSNYLLLSGGSPLVNGDGTVVQLGFYSASTTASPFSGNWVQLGAITIGDNAQVDSGGLVTYFSSLGNGSYSLSDSAVNLEITTGRMLAVRFFDGNSVANSQHYNVVTAIPWAWPGGEKHEAFLTASRSPIWLGGASSAYRTSLAVPELTSCFLAFAGLSGWCLRRQRDG